MTCVARPWPGWAGLLRETDCASQDNPAPLKRKETGDGRAARNSCSENKRWSPVSTCSQVRDSFTRKYCYIDRYVQTRLVACKQLNCVSTSSRGRPDFQRSILIKEQLEIVHNTEIFLKLLFWEHHTCKQLQLFLLFI